jgi:hypothetical protein
MPGIDSRVGSKSPGSTIAWAAVHLQAIIFGMEPRRGLDEDIRALKVAVVTVPIKSSISYQIASASLESSSLYLGAPYESGYLSGTFRKTFQFRFHNPNAGSFRFYWYHICCPVTAT